MTDQDDNEPVDLRALAYLAFFALCIGVMYVADDILVKGIALAVGFGALLTEWGRRRHESD